MGLDFADAACICEGTLTALPFLRDSAKISKGQKILINGASGGVGVYAVQLAKYFGAHVTGVCSTKKVSLVKSLGADSVIDYTKHDFTADTEAYDIIFDAVGKSSFSRCKKCLRPGGVYLTTVPSANIMLSMMAGAFSKNKKAVFSATGLRKPEEKRKDLLFLNTLINAGEIKSVIGKTFSLEQMANAHSYVETGHKRGSAAVLIANAASI